MFMHVGLQVKLGSAKCFEPILIQHSLEMWHLLNKFFVYEKALSFIFRNAEQQRILWKIPDISQKSENGGNVITGLNLM